MLLSNSFLQSYGNVQCRDIYEERHWLDRYNATKKDLCTNSYNSHCRNHGYTGMADMLSAEDLYAVATIFQSEM